MTWNGYVALALVAAVEGIAAAAVVVVVSAYVIIGPTTATTAEPSGKK
jgi:hypothetical protein